MEEENKSPEKGKDDGLNIENLPGGTRGCVPEIVEDLELEDPLEIDAILEGSPELWKLSRTEAVKELGFTTEDIILKDQYTGKKAIFKKDQYVSIVSPKYVICPNEWVASGIEEALSGTDLTLHEDRSDGKKMFRYYLDLEHPAGPNGELQAGFLVRNSIDGSMGFSVGAFAYRQICTNGMVTSIDFGALSWVHMSGLENLDMMALMEMVKKSVDNALNDCRIMEKWNVPYVELPQGELVLSMLRSSRLPNTVRPPYLQEPNSRVKAAEIPAIPQDRTFWEIYNEFTDMISHKEISERTRIEYQGILHKTLALVLRVPV